MSGMPQNMVDDQNTGDGSLGQVSGYSFSNAETLSAMFPQSPIHGAQPIGGTPITNESIRKFYQNNVLDGTRAIGNNITNFNMEFDNGDVGPPKYDDVVTGGGGNPASAWVPNPVSPGEGSDSAGDKGKPPEGFGQPVGGAPLGPKTSSELIAKQKLGELLPVDSPGGSRSS